jgi:hypothetical protein
LKFRLTKKKLNIRGILVVNSSSSSGGIVIIGSGLSTGVLNIVFAWRGSVGSLKHFSVSLT